MRNTTLYKLAGPKTFRRASTKILGQWGGNVQNVEKSMREIYESDGQSPKLYEKMKYWLETGDHSVFTEEELSKLRALGQRDQSGAEALIVAYDCRPADYRQLFIHNVKPHVYVALKLFPEVWKLKSKEKNGVTLDVDTLSTTSISKLKENSSWHDLDLLIKDSDNWQIKERYYYFAKQTVHSANYDIQWATFVMNVLEKSGGKIVIDRKEGIRFLEVYRSLFPEIPERNNRVKQQVEETRLIYNMLGFPYQITDYNLSKIKDYFAWGPQSTVGEITRIAFTNLQEYIESAAKRWDILQDNHDSYLGQFPLTEVREYAEKSREYMNQRLVSPVDGAVFNMKSEFQVGFNWAPYKKGVNELGLRELKWL